jgi:putative CocE/NonD family hydrolase
MKLFRRLLVAVTILGVLIVVGAQLKQLPGEKPNPAGFAINSAHFVTTSDGTRIAFDLWLPADLEADQQIPALVEGSRYWRATRVTTIGRLFNLFGLSAPGSEPDSFTRYFNARDYAYLKVVVRGNGASFGVHVAEYSREEIADYAALFDWIVAQPWSNGRIGALGVSYAGTTAELVTTLQHPALQAVAPLYADFDAQYGLVTPGGVYQPAFVEAWNSLVSAMDRDDLCAIMSSENERIEGLKCLIAKAVAGGAKPVDDPEGMALLRQAIAEHDSPDVQKMVEALVYRDSPWGNVDYTTRDALPYGRKAEIEASGVPMYVMTGWHDAATTDGALSRFASFSNRQTVIIGPFSHGGARDTDPYQPVAGELAMSGADQMRELEQFFAAYLHDQGEPPPVRLRYFVQGSRLNGPGQWREVTQWPPADLVRGDWYLHADGRLETEPPRASTAVETLTVDYTAAAAGASRWLTQLNGSDVAYLDRDTATATGLNFVTPAFTEDRELTGNVIIDLWLSSDREDGAVHVYLDDVAPDGQVRYLSEGVLRLIHRAPQSQPFYPQFGPAHSFLEADAAPMPSNVAQQVSLSLFATSALIRAGHKLRIAITGADSESFARYPAAGSAPSWQIHRSAAMPSKISLPFRDHPETASPATADTAPVHQAETPASLRSQLPALPAAPSETPAADNG